MLKTLKNAWRIPELRSKLLFTLLIIVLYRLGANIPVPYVDPAVFESASAVAGGTILYYLNILSGDALGRATLFALGVSPYITASIVMQLLTIAIPPLERLAKQGDEGRKKITAITRLVTVALALVTAIGYAFYLDASDYLVVELGWFNGAVIVACYCAGAALVMWLAEKINESGIGNGISIILFANIIAGMFGIAQSIWTTVFTAGGFSGFSGVGLVIAIAEIIVLVGMIMIIVWMSDAERRIPIQYAKRVVGRKMYGGQNTNLPLKVNMAGVMPIIFANSIVAIPATIASFMNSSNGFVTFINKWFNYNTWPYLIVFLVLLLLFAFFYVAISFNPVEVANNIKNNGGAIPGIRSGKPTVMYIKKILNRITLLGALIIAFIACFPMIVNIIDTMITPDSTRFAALSFGGSSLIIVVGVALETVRELEAQMSLRNYKGFLD
ncbi:MAG: preprotein translocase subunit SecY [Clostridia bacterium]|nr:preprotein translocase subunit SecY [Clostridia bacterium]